MIRIKVDDKEVKELFKNLKDSGRRVLSRSLNKTVTGLRTDATREVSKQSGAQIKYVRRVLTRRLAKPSRLEAQLIGRSTRLPITAFGARQTKKGITFKGKGGVRKLIPGAFIQKTATQNKYRGAWMRKIDKTKSATGKDYAGRGRRGRLPLRKLKAVSVGHVLVTNPVVKVIHKEIDKRWHKAIKQSIDLELNGKKNFKS